MTGTSVSTQARIFTALAVFLSTPFDRLDLSPCPGELLSLFLLMFMQLVTRAELFWETAQRTGLHNQKTLTSTMQHLAHTRTMTLAKQEFG